MTLPWESREPGPLVRMGSAAGLAAAILMASSCGPKAAPTPVTPPTASAKPTPAAPVPVPAPVPAPSATPVPSLGPVAAAPVTPAPLLGHVSPAALKAYAPWALLWEQHYVPDPAAVATIKRSPKNYTVLLVLGTWCPDSKREVPRYVATMAAAGIGDAMLTMVGVDRTKKDTEGLTEKWNITRVPTWVFFRDGKEIGRFVEKTPAGSTFEAEIAKILGGGQANPARR